MDDMTIPLDAEAVSAPNAYHLAVVFAFMVSPDDPQLRKRVMHSGAVQHGMDLMAAGRLSLSEIKKLAIEAFDATSPSDLQQFCGERFDRGYAAGMIFHQSCKALVLGSPRSPAAALKHEKNRVAKILFRDQAGTSSHVETVWKVFRPAAALWGTFVELSDDRDGTVEHPCNREELPNWLACFEAFRELGEQTRTHKKGQPVLPVGKTFRLPPKLIALLPRVNLAIA